MSLLVRSGGVSIAAFIILAAGACDNDELAGVKAEVNPVDIRLDMPAVPEFELPAETQPHNVREMRLRGAKHLNTEVQVKGFITWIYDCFESGGAGGPAGTPEMKEKEIRTLIAEGRGRCWHPHLLLGDSVDTPGELGILVVEVQRELRKDETKAMPKEELAALPPVPVYKVGDEVIITGQWMQRSPKGFAETRGLLVYKALEHIGDETAQNTH